MNFDVRVELILFICEKVKKMKCFGASCLIKYLESDYVNRLKYKQSSRHRNGTSSVLVKSCVTLEGDIKTHASMDGSNHSGSIKSENQQGTQRAGKNSKQYDETSQLLDHMVPARCSDAIDKHLNVIEYTETEFSSGDSNNTI